MVHNAGVYWMGFPYVGFRRHGGFCVLSFKWSSNRRQPRNIPRNNHVLDEIPVKPWFCWLHPYSVLAKSFPLLVISFISLFFCLNPFFFGLNHVKSRIWLLKWIFVCLNPGFCLLNSYPWLSYMFFLGRDQIYPSAKSAFLRASSLDTSRCLERIKHRFSKIFRKLVGGFSLATPLKNDGVSWDDDSIPSI